MSKEEQNKREETIPFHGELNYRIGVVHLKMVREERSLYGMGSFASPENAAEIIRPLFDGADREMVVALSMDVKGNPIAAEVVAIGSLDCCIVSMRELFKHAVLSNAAALLCFHNHPSGDPEPSKEDVEITKRMIKAGELLGIPLVDHIILGDSGFVSLKDRGCGNLWANAP